jgi:hypothetical protein
MAFSAGGIIRVCKYSNFLLLAAAQNEAGEVGYLDGGQGMEWNGSREDLMLQAWSTLCSRNNV